MKKSKKKLYDELTRQYLFEQLFENIHSQLLLLDEDYKKEENELLLLFQHIRKKANKDTLSDLRQYLNMQTCHQRRFYCEIYLHAIRNVLYILNE